MIETAGDGRRPARRRATGDSGRAPVRRAEQIGAQRHLPRGDNDRYLADNFDLGPTVAALLDEGLRTVEGADREFLRGGHRRGRDRRALTVAALLAGPRSQP